MKENQEKLKINEYKKIIAFLVCVKHIRNTKVPKYILMNILAEAKLDTFYAPKSKTFYAVTESKYFKNLSYFLAKDKKSELKKQLFPQPEQEIFVFNTKNEAEKYASIMYIQQALVLKVITQQDTFNPIKKGMIKPTQFIIDELYIPFHFFKNDIENNIDLFKNSLTYGNTLLSIYIRENTKNINNVMHDIRSIKPRPLFYSNQKIGFSDTNQPYLYYHFTHQNNEFILNYKWAVNQEVSEGTVNISTLVQKKPLLKDFYSIIQRKDNGKIQDALIKNIFHIFNPKEFPFLINYQILINEILTALTSLNNDYYTDDINTLLSYGADKKFIILGQAMSAKYTKEKISDHDLIHFLKDASRDDMHDILLAMANGKYTFSAIEKIFKKCQPNYYKMAIKTALPFLIKIYAQDNNEQEIGKVFNYYYDKCEFNDKVQTQLQLQLLSGYTAGGHYKKIPSLMLDYGFSSEKIIGEIKNNVNHKLDENQFIDEITAQIKFAASELKALENPSILKLIQTLLSYKKNETKLTSSNFPLFSNQEKKSNNEIYEQDLEDEDFFLQLAMEDIEESERKENNSLFRG